MAARASLWPSIGKALQHILDEAENKPEGTIGIVILGLFWVAAHWIHHAFNKRMLSSQKLGFPFTEIAHVDWDVR